MEMWQVNTVLVLTIESHIGGSRVWSRHVTQDQPWDPDSKSSAGKLILLEQARSIIKDEMEAGVRGVVVDLSQMQWINSTGMGLIVAWRKVALDGGGEIVLAVPAGRVADTLGKVQLDQVMPIFDSAEAACGHFLNPGIDAGKSGVGGSH